MKAGNIGTNMRAKKERFPRNIPGKILTSFLSFALIVATIPLTPSYAEEQNPASDEASFEVTVNEPPANVLLIPIEEEEQVESEKVAVEDTQPRTEVAPVVRAMSPATSTKAAANSDFTYEINSDETITITGLANTELTELVIPDEIDGMPVTSIGATAFANCESLTSFDIPDTVTSIGRSALRYCNNLSSVTLPDNPAGCTLGQNCLADNPKLTSIFVPASITSANSPFYHSGIVTATIEEGATTVLASLFQDCTALTTVNLPASITGIGATAFENCKALEDVVLPDSVTKIGRSAYYGTTSLRLISMPRSITEIGASAFNNSSPTFFCAADSYPIIYAIENNRPFVVNSTFTDNDTLALDRSACKFSAGLDAVYANGYISVTAEYAIKSAWTSNATPSKVKIWIPEGVDFDDTSLTLDGAPVTNYKLTSSGHVLEIPVKNASGSIKFQVHLATQDDFTSYASLEMTKNGTKSLEVIGIINEPMDVLTVEAPRVVNEASFEMSGIAPASSPVVVYFGGEAIATTTSSKVGTWKTSVTIPGAKDYRAYVFTVMCQAEESELSQTVWVTYEPDASVMTSFTLTYYEHKEEITCDLLNSTTKPLVYFTPKQEFTFEIGYSNPEEIDTLYVTSTRNNETKYMEAEYDDDKGVFVASGYFDPNNHEYVPGVIGVEYSRNVPDTYVTDTFDLDRYKDMLPDYSEHVPEVTLNDDGQYETEIDFCELYPEVFSEPTKFGIKASDWKRYEELAVIFKELYDEFDTTYGQPYIVSGMNGEQLELFMNASLDDKLLMLVKDVSSNKWIEVAITIAAESTASMGAQAALGTVAGVLPVVSTIANFMLEEHAIASDLEQLKKDILESDMTEEQKQEALKQANDLAIMRHCFIGLVTAVPLLMLAFGVAAPVIVVTSCLLAAATILMHHYWDYRAGLIRDGKFFLKWCIDPSGQVYDEATGDPLEGVTTTAYWIESDGSDTFFDTKPSANVYGTLWDASEYDQVNPLQTNADGKYAWDVPEGWWRVKYEREGYETQWSDWMTVPPIQTGVDAYLKPLAAQKTGWQQDGDVWHFYNDDGTMRVNDWAQVGTTWYYLGADGQVVLNGWSYYDGVQYYMGKNGKLAKNTWAQVDGQWYYIGSNYQPVKSNWVSYGGKYYFMDKNGHVTLSDWVPYAGKYYYVGANGTPVVNKWEQIAGIWYHFNASGACDQVYNAA